MEARARTRYLRMSPKKMRQVAELIKGKPVEEAMNILSFTPKAAAHYLAKTLKSAASNAIASVGTAKLKAEDLTVKKIYVDSAPTAKRVRFQSMGRVFRIRKRYCHLTVEVEGEPEPEKPKARVSRKKKVESEKPSDDTEVKKAAPKRTRKAKPKGAAATDTQKKVGKKSRKKEKSADMKEVPPAAEDIAVESGADAAVDKESDESEDIKEKSKRSKKKSEE